jgi:DNA excision repair protein ERCC-6
MGLGKTIEIVGFFAGLHHSGKFSSCLLLCPATIMSQWVREFHLWYPPMRVVLFHESGTSVKKPQAIVDDIVTNGGVLVTTYEHMRIHAKLLSASRWGYVVLDEGHKIRNPDAEITLAVKSLKSPHRILMSGSPIQNKLVELWSLFDFVFPGRLGTLPVFESEFALPISLGGYANATPVQVQTAYRCAVVLRDLIDPYLLRRLKEHVNLQLPEKTEQVLFCSLTQEQRKAYIKALNSTEIKLAMQGKYKVFAALMILRKICSHPDLLQYHMPEKAHDYGAVQRSGKMQLLEKLLPAWKQGGHRVLLFSQTRQMLDILETFVLKSGYEYRRMDGASNIRSRMSTIDEFNSDESIFCFLLTTKVGGLGVNLTGADRVVLFDPDWNPSTDQQARERAWRVGQKREVIVYRLVVSGTIEEKIYHRQIFKTFLTNKVLKDPRYVVAHVSCSVCMCATLALLASTSLQYENHSDQLPTKA